MSNAWWLPGWVIDVVKTVVINIGCGSRHPRRPRNLMAVVIKENRPMAQAKVTLTWSKSVTPSVTAQKLQLSVNGVAQPLQTLTPDVQTFELTVNEKDVVAADLWATDGLLDSSHLTGSFTVPEITAPAAPTNLAFTFTPVTSV